MNSEALILVGATQFFIPPPDPPYLSVLGGVHLIVPDNAIFDVPNPHLIPRGTMHIDHLCVSGDFPVTERLSKLEGDFWLDSYCVPRPLHRSLLLEAFIGGPFSTPQLLSSNSLPASGDGSITMAVVNSHFPFPVPDGIEIQRSAAVAYKIDQHFVRLFNTPTDGSYSLILTFILTNNNGLNERIRTEVKFVGNDAIIGGDYYEIYEKCLRDMQTKVNSYAKEHDVPPWEPVEHPNPEEVFEGLRALGSISEEGAVDASSLFRLAHNAEYLEAVLSLPDVEKTVFPGI